MNVDLIRTLAKEKGVSITNLEALLGFGNGTIGKWIKQSPSSDKLNKVADFLGVTMDYLYTGKEKNSNLEFKNEEQIYIEKLNFLTDIDKDKTKILNRISELMGNREQRELTNYLGINNGAFSEWKSGKSKSYIKYLIEIAEFFDVSIDYLVYGKEKSPSSDLTDKGRELLEMYGQLTEHEQGIIIGEMREMLRQHAEHKNGETA